MASRVVKGTVPKGSVTAVLIKGCETWLPVLAGTFDIVEVNFLDEVLQTLSGGVVGIRFASTGKGGRPAWIFTTMDSVAAIQLEEPTGEPPPGLPGHGND